MVLDRQAELVAGVDIGGTYIKVGLVDRSGEVVTRVQIESHAERGWATLSERIGHGLQTALDEAGKLATDLVGIGVGYPGTVYPETGIISGSPNVPGSQGSNLIQPLRDRFQRAILPMNDASAAALGEWMFGQGRGREVRHLAMFTLGTGVGGGVVSDGTVLVGAHHQGAELGHMIIDPHGPQCGCGNFGCLEAFCGTAGILRCAWEKLQAGRSSLLWDLIDEFESPELTPKMISLAADRGDEVALDVWADVGRWLGLGCVSVINFMDPELIVIGGQIAGAGAPLFEAVRRTVRARQRLNPWPIDRILPAKLGADAGIIGSAAVVFAALDPAGALSKSGR